MYNLSQVHVPKDFGGGGFLDDKFRERTPGKYFKPYILPGKLGNSEFHFSVSDEIVEDIHVKTDEAFCFMDSREKSDLVSAIAETYLSVAKDNRTDIRKTIMHIPEEKLFEYEKANLENIDGMPQIWAKLFYATARDWGNEWHKLADNANVPIRWAVEGGIIVGSYFASGFIPNIATFERVGIGLGMGAVTMPLMNLIETKKAKLLREIANSEVYISLE